MNSCAPASFAASFDFLRGMRRACRMRCCSSTVPGEQVNILLHHADVLRAALCCVSVRMSLPVDADAAARHVVEARNQVAQRGFARAGQGPTNGDRLPRTGRSCAGCVMHFGVVVLIMEGNVVERDFAACTSVSTFGVRRVHNRPPGSSMISRKAVDAGHAALELLGEFNDAADGVQQHVCAYSRYATKSAALSRPAHA